MTDRTRVFLYGTLCDTRLLEIVAGGLPPIEAARLADHAVYWARDETFPLIVDEPGAAISGLLVTLDDEQKARLDFYEIGFGYTLEPRVIETDSGLCDALVYFPEVDRWEIGARWSLADWQGAHGPLIRNAAEEYIRLFGKLSPEAAANAFPQVRARASSRMRASKNPSPAAFAPEMSASEARIHETRQPYTDYFAVREDDLSFPHFDGSESARVRRATFMGGDAVTILPYDPKTDSVLVVRQFRHGAFVRADANPWCLEPVAGRIDPGEEPEAAAHRELREETGLVASRLYKIAGYYPSPAAYSEFLFSYVAISDLSGADGTVGGLAGEAEDIMAHVVSLDNLTELVASGAANTAPLILSAQWLVANRQRLRAAD